MPITHTRTVASPLGDITLLTLTNANGCSVTLSSLGAGIVELWVPDREGNLLDVALGYANAADYLADGPCMGKTPGRYANRIARGQVAIDGSEYQLPINNGPNHLHGGPEGFQNRLWTPTPLPDGARFTLCSPHADMGYPGTMLATVTYRWANEGNSLEIRYHALSDRNTIINLTNHTYFNLNGHNSGSVLGHTLCLNSSRYLPTDPTLIPLGESAPVEGTPMDFRRPKTLGCDMGSHFPALRYGKGYDNCWVCNRGHSGEEPIRLWLTGERSGISLQVATDQSGVQIYTGNYLSGSPLNKSGRPYNDYDGVAIECQTPPNAPNNPHLDEGRLQAGEPYQRFTTLTFTA